MNVPVTTVGRIIHPEFAETLLLQGKADLVALGRPLICDPQWPLKTQEGRIDEIREMYHVQPWLHRQPDEPEAGTLRA